jgi:hypothetical protein
LLKLRTSVTALLLLLTIALTGVCTLTAQAQHFELDSNKKQVTLHFDMVRNMIIVPVFINQKGPFNFVLDTGVGVMVITDPLLVDSVSINKKRKFKLFGQGNNDGYDAYITSLLNVTLPGIYSKGVAAAVMTEDHFGLSNYAGMPIHGLLGYEFFNRLAVKFDFSDSTLTAYAPHHIRLFRKAFKLPITIEEHKPYVLSKIALPNGQLINSKLIVDLGAGHPLSIENNNYKPCPEQKTISANLGVGLTGPITGAISRINELNFGKYKFKNVITSYPDSGSYNDPAVRRDGNLGLGILKKFLLLFDYENGALYLKPNSRYKEPFEHDMSGMEYYASGPGLKHIVLSRVEPGSAADKVGLKENDEITAINFKPVVNMNIMDIDNLFKSGNNRTIMLEVCRDKKYEWVLLTLERRI